MINNLMLDVPEAKKISTEIESVDDNIKNNIFTTLNYNMEGIRSIVHNTDLIDQLNMIVNSTADICNGINTLLGNLEEDLNEWIANQEQNNEELYNRLIKVLTRMGNIAGADVSGLQNVGSALS